MKPRYLLATIILLLAALTMVWLRRPAEFKRYVSPPLPDGTRYTFVYPRRMTQIVPSRIHKQPPPIITSVLGGVYIDDVFTAAPSGFQKWLNGLLKRSNSFEVSYVSVAVHSAFDASVPPRREDKTVSSSFLSRLVQLEDRRTRQRFWLACSVPSVQHEQAEQETKTIADSFRVLRPGKAVP